MFSDLRKHWQTATKGWLGVVTYSILGIVLALLIQHGGGFLLGTDLPVVTVSSNSMVPKLNVGDLVIVKGADKYHAGDIIVFDGWREHPIIHRVVMMYDGQEIERYNDFNEFPATELVKQREEGQIFVTKGDNNNVCDQCAGENIVTEGSVHGKYVFKIPYVGLVKIGFNKYLLQPLLG